jgi:hypothetical protein
MPRAFIYNDSNDNFVEAEDNLLYHDLCVIFDEEDKIVYLWNGPRSNSERLKLGIKALNALTSDFPDVDFKIKVLDNNIPTHIQNKIDSMSKAIKEKEQIEMLKFSLFTTIRVYFLTLIVVLILPIVAVINLILPFFSSLVDGIFNFSAEIYENWINLYRILMLITLIGFILNMGIGIYEQDDQVIIFSIMGLLISIGITIYLSQGIYLFLFQEGSTSTKYIISLVDVLIFVLINLGAILIFEIPNIYKLKSFFKTYREFIF